MPITRIVGFVLIAVGLVSVLYGGISWTRQKTVVDIGPIQARTEERRTLPVPPLLGGAILVAGVILVVAPVRRRA